VTQASSSRTGYLDVARCPPLDFRRVLLGRTSRAVKLKMSFKYFQLAVIAKLHAKLALRTLILSHDFEPISRFFKNMTAFRAWVAKKGCEQLRSEGHETATMMRDTHARSLNGTATAHASALSQSACPPHVCSKRNRRKTLRGIPVEYWQQRG
jgi:hypothetical protein